MFGVVIVATFRVRDTGEAMPYIALVVVRHTRGYFSERVRSVRVKDESDFFADIPQGPGDGFGDEYFAQVTDVNVARRADAANDYVWPVAEIIRDAARPVEV